MKPEFYATDTYPADFLNETPPRREDITEICTGEGETLAYVVPDHETRILSTLRACHGLALPPDIAPGALAALVTAAQQVHDWHRPAKHDHEDTAWRDLRTALAPFTTDPAPVSPPPAGYAIKTPSGYLATQGREQWFESEPVGWALYSTRDHAAGLAKTAVHLSLAAEVVEVPATPAPR